MLPTKRSLKPSLCALLSWFCSGLPLPAAASDQPGAATAARSEVIRVSERRSNLLLFNSGDEIITGTIDGGSQLFAWGSSGTTLSTDQGRMGLHTGRLLVDNGKQPLTIGARLCSIRINPGVTAVIEQHPQQPVRIMVVGGPSKPSLRVKPLGKVGRYIWLLPGEELILSDRTLPEAVDSDRLERHAAPLAEDIPGLDSRKQSFSREDFARQELARVNAAIKVSGTAAYKRLEEHLLEDIDRVSSDLLPETSSSPAVAAKAPAKARGPLHMLASGGSELSQQADGAIRLRTGSFFLDANHNAKLETNLGEILIDDGALLSVQVGSGSTRVSALSGPGDVSLLVDKHKITLGPGQEALITDHSPTAEDTTPKDGIGRRDAHPKRSDSGIFVTLADFSMVSMIDSADHLRLVRRPRSARERQLLQHLLKTAAAVETLTRAKGPYRALPKSAPSRPSEPVSPAA